MSGYMRQLSHISFAQGPSSVLQLSPNQEYMYVPTGVSSLLDISTTSPYQLAVMEGWNYINADWLGQVLFLTFLFLAGNIQELQLVEL